MVSSVSLAFGVSVGVFFLCPGGSALWFRTISVGCARGSVVYLVCSPLGMTSPGSGRPSKVVSWNLCPVYAVCCVSSVSCEVIPYAALIVSGSYGVSRRSVVGFTLLLNSSASSPLSSATASGLCIWRSSRSGLIVTCVRLRHSST